MYPRQSFTTGNATSLVEMYNLSLTYDLGVVWLYITLFHYNTLIFFRLFNSNKTLIQKCLLRIYKVSINAKLHLKNCLKSWLTNIVLHYCINIKLNENFQLS